MPSKRRIMPKYEISAYDENRAKVFIKEILNNLEYEKEVIPKQHIGLSFWSAFLTWRWQMGLTAGIKQVDKKKCTKCGLCVNEICPSGAITWDAEGFPKIRERICVGCNGCVNLCPVDAIWALSSKNNHQYDAFRKFIIGFN